MTLRFAIAVSHELGAPAFADLDRALTAEGAPPIEPVFVASYAALTDAIHMQQAELGWTPPLVARELVRIAAADPIVTVLRNGVDHYYGALVARGDARIRTLQDLQRARVGWVSEMSAAGYIVPRNYLRSVGIPLEFRSERFYHSHAKLVRALGYDEIDVAATYATREGSAFRVRHLPAYTLLATAGPIPGDVVVAARWISKEERDAVTNAFVRCVAQPAGAFARLMEATGFTRVMPWHLETLARWFDQARRGSSVADRSASSA
jgi:ABC-type phosphate/phosphonate transport system substrate-binding protein